MNKAFLFDLNGTMVDDMEFHAKAWYSVLNDDLQANLSWDEVNSQMYGKNSELLERVFGKAYFSNEQMDRLSIEKEKKYQLAYRPHLRLIEGLDDFLERAYECNILMGIGSAAIPFNIDFVLDNLQIRKYFSVVISADDVIASKPNPETFIKGAELLKLSPADCIVFEDAPKGVEAALNAGMKTVVLTTMHNEDAFKDYSNILAFVKDYRDPVLEQLFEQ